MKHVTKTIIAIILLALTLAVLALSKPKVITLTKENHTAIVGEFTGASVNSAIKGLVARDRSKPFYLYIDSPGGEVFAGKRLVDFLIGDSENVICVTSNAMSMAFVTMQACPVRYATHTAVFMSHGIQLGVQGSVKTIEAELIVAKKLEEILNVISASRIGITVEELVKRQDPEWWIAGGNKAVKANVADAVVAVKCDESLKGSKKETVQTIFGPAEIQITQCPL